MTMDGGLFVNVGSGPDSAPGWMSIDGSWQAWLAGRPLAAWAARLVTGRDVGRWDSGIHCRDVRRGLGLPSDSAAVVYSSHLIEHLHRSDAVALVRECRRVLKPGGVCRIVTPDLAPMVDYYVKARGTDAVPTAADALQAAMQLHPVAARRTGWLLSAYRQRTSFDDHKWIYDGRSLCALFAEAGFPRARVRGYLDSEIPRDRLTQVEQASRVVDGAGVCVEASKE
jgi:SAM-dependent methyltransferase